MGNLDKKKYRILIAGGGTGGSVSPLLAVVDELRKFSGNFSFDFLWLGTYTGPEKEMVEKENLEFMPIASGKFRRYWDWRNIFDLWRIFRGFMQSLSLVYRFKPDIFLSAGSFVSVPAAWAAWAARAIIIIHQLDVRPGLANKLVAPLAKRVTVTFQTSMAAFGSKAIWTGNPVRQANNSSSSVNSREQARKFFNLGDNKPVVFVTGGGTGALAINQLVSEALPELLSFCNMIHQTGKGKNIIPDPARPDGAYYAQEFLSRQEMAMAYAAADIVVSRCGMATLAELAKSRKPAILIPMPFSHQLENAAVFSAHNAALVLDQNDTAPDKFITQIKILLDNDDLRTSLIKNMSNIFKEDAASSITAIIIGLLTKKE